MHGEHHVANALAAAAVALDAGMDLPVLGQALSRAGVGSAGRMQITVRPDQVVVIDDSYNANPDSVTAALQALVHTEPPQAPVGRRWAVLGEMLELGEDSDSEHERIGTLAVRLGVDRVLSVGAGGSAYRAPVQARDVPEALRILHSELRSGDVVLIKASRAVGLDAVARGLLESGAASGQDVAAARPGPGPDIESGEVLA